MRRLISLWFVNLVNAMLASRHPYHDFTLLIMMTNCRKSCWDLLATGSGVVFTLP